MDPQHSPIAPGNQVRVPPWRVCDRFGTEKVTIKNCNENLFSEDYTRTISSENYDENPFSKGSDRDFLGKDHTDMDKKTEEETQLTMTAIPGVRLDGLDRPYFRLDSYRMSLKHLNMHGWNRRPIEQPEARVSFEKIYGDAWKGT